MTTEKNTKFVFVTGGVVSGLGKGITAASLGALLKARGYHVSAQKLDPYMNVDPGTMSPYQHGEVFVTEDGAETDLDLGHYERFMDENLSRHGNLTSGRVYFNVLTRERSGGYLGQTVQVVPHITDEIKAFIYEGARKARADVMLVEVGGTIGDIESQPFLEAIRQVGFEVGRENCIFVHVTLVPYLRGSGEHKTKPTQHSVKELQGMGISPGILVARADEPLTPGVREKIAMFCNVSPDRVIENRTLPCLYEAPLMLEESGLAHAVCGALGLPETKCDLSGWQMLRTRINAPRQEVCIAIVGKYVQLHDAYLSVAEALRHAGFAVGTSVRLLWVDSETLDKDTVGHTLRQADGILVPGGFGARGIEGMVLAAHYARVGNVPYFGICLGMQIAVMEYARHVCGLPQADSGEFAPEGTQNVIDLMPDQQGITQTGGTMRLGAYPCVLHKGTRLHSIYAQQATGEVSAEDTLCIAERHRHRYEVNNTFRPTLEEHGLVCSGLSPDGTLVEAVELPSHRFYVAAQFHPEFKSRPTRPHPLFVSFVESAVQLAQQRAQADAARL